VAGGRIPRACARHDPARSHAALAQRGRALRRLPQKFQLDDVFLHRKKCKVRKDGTVRFRGGLLEVHPGLEGDEVELRFDPADNDALPRVFQDGHFVCDTVPLDRYRNASRKRRRFAGEPDPGAEPSGLDPLALIEAEHYQRVRPIAPRSVHDHDDHDHDDTEE
jgi:hypothetical protein